MQITLRPTTIMVTRHTPDGSVPCRIWEGETASGIAVSAEIALIEAKAGDDADRFERELLEKTIEPL